MYRFTTDNPQNNLETMLNLSFVKGIFVAIRDMKESFVEYTKRQCRKQGCNCHDMNDEEFCESITDCGFSNPECLVFLLFMVATQAAEQRERLKKYEDTGKEPAEVIAMQEELQSYQQAEQDGTLVKLPCKVGDTIWYLQEQYHGKIIAKPCTVTSFQIDNWFRIYGIEERQNSQMFYIDDFGKDVFLTKEEAEKALEGMK